MERQTGPAGVGGDALAAVEELRLGDRTVGFGLLWKVPRLSFEGIEFEYSGVYF
jgi:hypothetical protein